MSKTFPRVSKELNTLSSYFDKRFLQQPCTASRTNKCHGRLPVVDAIMSRRLASMFSTYWPIYGLKKECIDFTMDRLNPDATTPPQVVRTIPISHQLQLAPQNQLHQCAPFVDAFAWICFVLWFSVYSWFYCPNVECYAFIWNQPVDCSSTLM